MAGILEKTRTQGYLGEIDQIVDWGPIEELLHKDYPVGQSPLGNKAYQPLVLLKAALLQKWYGFRLVEPTARRGLIRIRSWRIRSMTGYPSNDLLGYRSGSLPRTIR